MKLFLVYCKDGSRWIPMGLARNDDSGEHLFSDGPFSLFRNEMEAKNWIIDAAAYHKDQVSDYKVEPVTIPK